jgi:hypothetical protein
MSEDAAAIPLRYLPIPSEIAAQARTRRRDRFGHELGVAPETAPCRLCLLILRAYSKDGRIVDAVLVQPGTAPAQAAAFLSDARVAEVHVRHGSYTCFDFKIVRAA